MNLSTKRVKARVQCLLILVPLCLAGGLQAKNKVLGQIQFDAANKAAKSSGVWIDGQYVGYLKELKGSKKILLLPGKHQIEVRQSGYHTFTQEVTLEPGQRQAVSVAMLEDPRYRYGNETATVKLSGHPDRAAVFVDRQFVGHVDQFNGLGQGMLLSPGKHEIRISLPGYQPFETEITLRPHQKLKIKTNLLPSSDGTQG